MFKNQDLILDILKEQGIVSAEQIKQARAQAHEQLSVLDSLVGLTYVSEDEIAKAIARQFGLQQVHLKKTVIDPDTIKMIPQEIAKRYQVIPYRRKKDRLQVAIADPFRLDVIDSLAFMLKMEVEAVLATEEDIREGLIKFYGIVPDGMESAVGFGSVQVPEEHEEGPAEEAPVIKLVSLIIMEALRLRASDIHLEPLEKRFRVRYRIDGLLYEMDEPPKRLQGSILSRIKIMANMSIAEKRLPQDGRIKLKVMGKDIDLRVSTLPSQHGESLVMRILDKSSLALGLVELGFMPDDEKKFKELIGCPNGILLITGPTGSGKTTTLYACLHEINRPDKKIITVEDPIEYQLSGINQVQVNEKIGLTFAHVLRSILRQAPNIIMVGEIRDPETANIAINASLTGHLVFSTLHTNDAAGAVTRLIDQGVKPFLVASSVRAVLAQRLVRRICPACKAAVQPPAELLTKMKLIPAHFESVTLFKGKGCGECNQTGYRGRVGLFELLIVDEEIQKMIYQRVPSSQIKRRARETGMRTLREDGVQKVFAGATTLEEGVGETEQVEVV